METSNYEMYISIIHLYLDKTIFTGLNLNIPSGKMAALVGPSGGGKSTVIQLVELFYDATIGEVFLDGKTLKSFNVKWV